MTLGKIREKFISELSGLYPANEARNICELVIENKLGLKKHQILLQKDHVIENLIENQLSATLEELKTGKPVQYVLGETEFCGLIFKLNKYVLIPRSETEELVYWIKENVKENSRILDVGTGSGCIAISLKHFLPDSSVYALDISEQALEVAKENSQINNCEINFLKKDVLQDDLEGLAQFDVIVSNPPYVTIAEKDQMHKNVLSFEPHSALFVPDNDPLLFYKSITRIAKDKLIKNGVLFFEINEKFGSEVKNLLSDNGLSAVDLKKDLQGKERMVKGIRK